ATSVALIGVIFALMRRDLRRSQRLAEKRSGALRESEQRFRRVFDESPVGILVAACDSRAIVQINPAYCRMLGVAPEQIGGQTLDEFVHVDDQDALSEAIRRGSSAEEGFELRHVARSGALSWARVRLTQLSGSNDGRGLLLMLAVDITREKRVEGELRQA